MQRLWFAKLKYWFKASSDIPNGYTLQKCNTDMYASKKSIQKHFIPHICTLSKNILCKISDMCDEKWEKYGYLKSVYFSLPMSVVKRTYWRVKPLLNPTLCYWKWGIGKVQDGR